jgi:2'-5' RNA ligase
MGTPSRPRRLFFALMPPEPARARLHQEAARLLPIVRGRAIPRENIHLTLVFLGAVDAALVPRVGDFASAVRGRRFVLSFDEVGLWPRSGILWAGCGVTPAPIADLVVSLRAGAGACGLAVDSRAFRPHVTLLRNARRRPPERTLSPPLEWEVHSFCLMESETHASGARYGVVRAWDLH